MKVWWYSHYLQGFRTPGPAECRLEELFPRRRGLLAAMNYLRTHGAFRKCFDVDSPRMMFKLAVEVTRYSEPVKTFLDAWQEPRNRIHLGPLIGDWDVVAVAAESAGQLEIAARAKRLAADAGECWLKRLRSFMEISACDDASMA